MASFAYRAISATGETLNGRIEAESVQDAIVRLQDLGHTPLAAEPAAADGAQALTLATLLGRGGLSNSSILALTEQLATLLKAGLPLDRGLQLIIELADSEPLRKLLIRVRDRVRGGATLSQALDDEHGVFSKLYINMIRAGEAGGSLDHSLDRLADYLKRAASLQAQVISALVYPAILMLIALGSVFVLLAFVVPQFKPLFEDAGAQLPLLTRIVMGVGDFVASYWWLLIGAAAGLVLVQARALRDPVTRLAFDRNRLRVPIFGQVTVNLEVARFTRTLGTLLKNGVPMLSALGIARNAMENSALAQAVAESAEEVKRGMGLAPTLARSGLFPRLALQMISIGEESGRLDELLINAASTFDDLARTSIERLLSLLVPVLVLMLAAIVGVIVASILFAIMEVNNLVA